MIQRVATTALVVQAGSFIVLGIALLIQGHTKLGFAQFLLAIVSALVYS